MSVRELVPTARVITVAAWKCIACDAHVDVVGPIEAPYLLGPCLCDGWRREQQRDLCRAIQNLRDAEFPFRNGDEP